MNRSNRSCSTSRSASTDLPGRPAECPLAKELAAFGVGAVLAVVMSSQGWRDGFTGLEVVLVLEQALMYGLMGVVVYGSLATTRVTSTLLGLDLKIDPLDVSPFVAIGRQSLWLALVFVGGITLSLLFIGMQPEYLLLWEFWVIYAPLSRRPRGGLLPQYGPDPPPPAVGPRYGTQAGGGPDPTGVHGDGPANGGWGGAVRRGTAHHSSHRLRVRVYSRPAPGPTTRPCCARCLSRS